VANKIGGWLRDINTPEAVQEILHSKKDDDFITALNILDEKKAIAFAKCIDKCRRHSLEEREKRYWLEAKAMCAVKGRRVELYAQSIAGIMVAEYFGGKSSNKNNGNGDGTTGK